MMPECMLQNIAQPHRNPAAGENISRRKTYTPPVRGYAEVSSAQMLAPNQVRTPAATQTSSMPVKLGTARLTSDGWTKIDEPTMVPTTIAVACVSPIERVSVVDTGGKCYHWGRRSLAGTEVTGGDGGRWRGRRSLAGTEVAGGDGGRWRGRRS